MKYFFLLACFFASSLYAQFNRLPIIYAEGGKGINYLWVKPSKEKMEMGWIWSDCSDGFYNTETSSILRASSVLPSQGSVNYSTKNLFDDNPYTAWVEGEVDYGIGTYLEVENCVILNRISILNGYQKSPKSFIENSRVKLLKLSLNGKDVCMIQLKDEMGVQSFSIEDIRKKITDENRMESIRFTIMDVYPGTKFKDVAISEMFNSGCCLSAGSLIALQDQTYKSFEALSSGDIITLMDANNKLVSAKVSSVGSVVHESMMELVTENGYRLSLTASHLLATTSIDDKNPARSLKPGQTVLIREVSGTIRREKILNVNLISGKRNTYYFKGLELLSDDVQWPLSIIVDHFITTDEYLEYLNKQHQK